MSAVYKYKELKDTKPKKKTIIVGPGNEPIEFNVLTQTQSWKQRTNYWTTDTDRIFISLLGFTNVFANL